MATRPAPVDLSSRPPATIPAALAQLHREREVGSDTTVLLPHSLVDTSLMDTVVGAGFRLRSEPRRADAAVQVELEREWTLPDTVGPDMTVLIVGLNPSPSSADSGVGFARPGNRFWPAVLAAGLAAADRDPIAALSDHGMGMTDVVKRTTRRASEVSDEEFRSGLERVTRTVARWEPETVAFVGLAGWRTALDRKAKPGWQDSELGGRPVYLLPSTSGLNASSQLPDFIEHFTRIRAGRS